MSKTPIGLPEAKYNPLTACYETPDGTSVAAELCDNVESASDVFRIARIREEQRSTAISKTDSISTDRELLELAAKAAGFSIVDIVESVAIVKAGHPIAFKWTPLNDDGDALRLAVKLNLDVCRGLRGPEINVAVLAMHGDLTCAEAIGDDPYAATRRAIVRAAAEIGRAMP